MAGELKEFGDLPAVGTPARTDVLAVTQAGVSKRETVAQVFASLQASDVNAALGYTAADDDDLALYLPLAGGVLTGPLQLAGAPSSNLHAATKVYVDNLISGLGGTYYTESEIDAFLLGKSNTGHQHTLADITDAGALAALNTIDNSRVAAGAAIAYSKLALAGSILNADINGSAAIALSKLAAVTASKALVSDGSGVIAPSSVTAAELAFLSGVTSGIQSQLSGKQASLGFTPENSANKGVAGGYASLDGSGKVPLGQLPDTVVGAVEYQGSWNASTNSPNLGALTPSKGDYYVVSTAGSTSLGGITSWGAGDWAIYNGSAWEKVDNTDAVASVAGKTGAVTLDHADITDWSEAVDDRVSALLVQGANITLTYDDTAGTLTVAAAASSGMTDPMTTRGDTIYRNASNATARLARGAAGTVLQSDGTDIAYGLIANANIASGAAIGYSKLDLGGQILDSDIVAMAATKLTGTIADARFPATLPAVSGANLTNLNGSNVSSGTVAAARVGAAGSDTYVQYNASGVLGASSGLTFNSGTGVFTAPKITSPAAATWTLGSTVFSDLSSGEYLRIQPKSAQANPGFFIFENDNQANYGTASPPAGYPAGQVDDSQAVLSVYARVDGLNKYWNAIGCRLGAYNAAASSQWKPMFEWGAEGWYADDGTQATGRHWYFWDYNEQWAIMYAMEEVAPRVVQFNGNLSVTTTKLMGGLTAAGGLTLQSTQHASANNDFVKFTLGPSGSLLTAAQFKQTGGSVAFDLGTTPIKFGSAIGSSDSGIKRTGSGALAISDGSTGLGSLNASALTIGGVAVMKADGSQAFTAVVGGVDPSSSNHLATKAYVDSVASGLQIKASVRVATTANITLSGAQTIDGVSVVAGERVLVKNQSTASQNGLYVCASGSWSRSTDADTSSEVVSGLSVWVQEGTTNADSQWVLTTDGTITLGSTSLTFTQVSGLGQISDGNGLTKTGNTLNVGGTSGRISVGADAVDIDAAYVGQTSITTLGTIATGVWNATAIGYSKLSLSNSIVNADVNSSAAIAYSKLNLATSIVNADISGSAAIAYSKLNLATSIVNGDVSASAAIAYSKLNLSGSIVNADISTSAAIAISKLASQTVRESMLKGLILPDTSGNVWFEPYPITATNDVFKHGVWVFADTSTKDSLHGCFDVPMNYNTSGTVKVYVIWTSTATSGTIGLEFAYRGVAGDDTTSLDQATVQEALTAADTAPTAANRRMVASFTITAGNLTAGGSMQWRFSRDGTGGSGTDNMAAQMNVAGLLFEFTT